MDFQKITVPTIGRGLDSEQERSRAADRIIADSDIQTFLKVHQLDQQILEGNYGAFLRFLDLKEGQEKDLIPEGFEVALELQGERDVCLVYRKQPWLLDYETRNQNYVIRDFPLEWLRYGLSDAQVSKTPERILLLKEFLRCLQDNTIPGIYLHGKSGIGKSFLMALFCNEATLLNRQIAYAQTRTLFEQLRTYLFEKKSQEYAQLLRQVIEADCLVLDDIGGERITEWSKSEALYSILDERYRLGKITCFTSNYSLAELIQLYGGDVLKNRRIISHLRNSANEVELIGINYRKFAKEGTK